MGQRCSDTKDLRLEEVVLQTDSIAINPLSTALGKIELTQPTNASVRLVVTEADLNLSLQQFSDQ
ncbi:MAG: hypothetical protein BRC49_08150 [Cyanobacteria bacterium SW_10_48_33]|nr:MAG: hypothetical protein BRC49_08150 [Cyanobacteria bacterium SW_10_48_33]